MATSVPRMIRTISAMRFMNPSRAFNKRPLPRYLAAFAVSRLSNFILTKKLGFYIGIIKIPFSNPARELPRCANPASLEKGRDAGEAKTMTPSSARSRRLA